MDYSMQGILEDCVVLLSDQYSGLCLDEVVECNRNRNINRNSVLSSHNKSANERTE